MTAILPQTKFVPKKLGIEVNDSVTWQGWEPGGEYTKYIILKNVQIKTQKLKYRGPSTRFFTTLYPKPIVLSSGTSYSLPVTFRPLEKDQYEDVIEFEANNGLFSIPMRAVLPKPNVNIPESLNFGMCAVKDSIEVTFEVKNTSELMTSFQWEVSEPFTFVPSSGTLSPKTACLIKATFIPKSALVHEAIAVCKYSHDLDNTDRKSMKVEGIGKFPHIVASTQGQRRSSVSFNGHEVLVDFGDVPVQTTAEKIIELNNFSPVNAPYQILQPSLASNIDTVFTCSQFHGIVGANTTERIKVVFSPHSPGVCSTDTFEVVALGATNCSVIKCIGKGKGPSVSLDSSHLDFTVVEAGQSTTRTFKIANSSNVAAAFQFLIDCSQSVFKLNMTCGILTGGESKTVIVHFAPSHPINYNRRLVCLVHNQNPVFIDLFGTCHTEQVKPAPLQWKHLVRYHTHVSRGLSKIPPEQLNNMLEEGKLQIDEKGGLTPAEEETLNIKTDNIPLSQLSPMEELFDDGSFGETSVVDPHVSFDIQHLAFGKVPDAMTVEQKTVNITNHTKGKITCQWMKDTKGIFSVFPENCDVLPLRTASFQVSFRPNASNQFFSAELECYAFYKSTRDYRLVEDSSFFPPWCLTLSTSGQTFTMGAETFIPRYDLDTRHLIFPAITPDQAAYHTLLMVNTGTNPIEFAFDEDTDRIFSCRPRRGLLTDKYQLITFRMIPPEPRVFKQTLKCRLNDADKFTQDINLTGSAEVPHIQLEAEGTLYFKQTCIGTSSTRPFAVKNTSRIPLRFEWRVPGSDVKILSIQPNCGEINSNETQSHLFNFTPLEEKKYLLKPKLFVSSVLDVDDSSSSDIKCLVRVIGEGSIGEIICVDPVVDLGDIVVGGSLCKDLTIHNNSDCSLHYNIMVDQEINGPYDDEETTRDVLAIELSGNSDIIPARTSKKITVTVFPARRVNYKFLLSYTLQSTHDDKHVITRDKTPLAELFCQGVYPTLSLSDVRGLGSNKGLSKVKLWNLFSLDSLNECLDSDPSPPELMYVAATRHSTKRRVPVYTRAVMDFNFGAAPTGSDPSIVYLNLQNTGSVPSDWAFLYPSDLQLELEYWAETGEYEPDELHEMQVMDNRLFTVEPKKGKLAPGQSQTILLTYKHLFKGLNKLPVIFKITKGREILLNFIGVTVDEESRYVHFDTTKHMFEPIPVGTNSPPVQIYELYNGGALPVNYELDLEPLAQLEGENYGCRILDCLNPSGEIPPGCTALIHWVFAPLEAKTYVVDIPIRIIGGDSVLVTFTGVGFDQRIMGDTMRPRDSESIGVPSKQVVPIQHQLACLSNERISLGNLPLYSVSRRSCFISNSSADHVISFRWLVEGTPAEQVMMIEPLHGYLHPGQSILLKVSFFSTGPPSLYDLDVLCEIVDETEMAEFNQRLIEWTNKQEERQYTFTITEEDIKTEKTNKRPRSGQKLKSIKDQGSNSQSKSEGDLRKYNALPPIGSAEKQDRTSAKKKTKKAKHDEEPSLQPTPPESFWLHLGVTTRTHPISDFNANFPSEIGNFIIDQRFILNQENTSGQQDLSELVTCTQSEMAVVTDLISVILRGLLFDENFHHSLKELAEEPVPYFRQLCETPFMYNDSRPSSSSSRGEEEEELTGLSKTSEQESVNDTKYCAYNDEEAIRRTHEIVERPQSTISIVDHLKDQNIDPEWRANQRQKSKNLPEFQSMIEAVIENTIHNILTEASREEVNLSARPRVIALPPSRVRTPQK